MIVEALHNAGGVDYLTDMAKDHPSTFASLIAKVMPTQVDANVTTKALPSSVDEFV